MKITNLIGKRYKEKPSEATLESHAFLLRGGYVRQVANGIYSFLPAGLRVIKKIEKIIREEMNRIGGLEVLMPVVLTRELWEKTGRYDAVGSELVRFRDRAGHAMLLAMTHEEAVVHLTMNEISSYKDLPFMLYQIQTKFRDEPRSRGGLIRVREFTMKDAYSFHTSQEDLEKYYEKCRKAYLRIFARSGIPEVVVVESDTGIMAGQGAHEFMLLTPSGEDVVVKCNKCSYMANRDVAVSRIKHYPEEEKEMEKVYTPGLKTIPEVAKFLGVEICKKAKVVLYQNDSEGKLVVALIRGDMEVNEAKLAKIIGTPPVLAEDEKILASGVIPGFASVRGLSKEKCRIIIDASIKGTNNLVCGANEVDYHYKNFNLERDYPGSETVDIAQVNEGDTCPCCDGSLEFHNAIEVGNIFKLGTKYTKTMEMKYVDEKGKEQYPIMGCYGIGVGRLMSSVMEVRRDDFGPVWPISIAPWEVHINVLDISREEVKSVAEKVYSDMINAGIEVIMDDRNESAGVHFADADLLGVPFRCIISRRTVKDDEVEWKIRGEKGKGKRIKISDILNFALEKIRSAKALVEEK